MTKSTFDNGIQYLGFIVGGIIYVVFVVFVYYWCQSQNEMYYKICLLAVVSIFFYGSCPVSIGIEFWAKINTFDAILDVANLIQVCIYILLFDNMNQCGMMQYIDVF